MITGWVKNLIFSVIPGGADQRPNEGAGQIGQGAQTYEKKSKAKLIDVTDGLFVAEEARRQSQELFTIVRKGGSHLDRIRFWLGARRKVKQNMADFYDIPGILEEVTEKITEVSQHDPYYKKLFS